MVCVAQRVREASVAVGPEIVARIGPGLLLLVGVAAGDTPGTGAALAERVAKLRVFADPSGRMGLALADTGGEALAVSQFTLLADFSKGNRPSFHRAAPPEEARPALDAFVATLAARIGRPVPTGVFGADMRVALVNDGPATFVLSA